MGEILYRGYASTGSMSSAYPPDQATNLVAKAGKNCVKLTWTDPEDKTLAGGIVVRWYYTKIVRRTDRYPNDENDGVTVVLNSVRNQYQTNPYIDTGLESDVTYYYAAFACSTDEDEVISTQGVNVSVTTSTYRTMTVNINFNESDPTKMCSYADDAVGAPCGLNAEATTFWQEFFGYKPCLLKDGVVMGYLNPNDYTKFEDGTSADITSGDSGDVMIEYPVRGIKFSKSNKITTISVTDDMNAEGYTYYAHSGYDSTTLSFTILDKIYIGAYIASNVGTKLRSLSGKEPSGYMSLNEGRANVHLISPKAQIMHFYHYMYIQIMYCFQFANNLNSQQVLGYGMNNLKSTSGSADTKGLIYGTPSANGELKLFGLENPWGVIRQILEGFVCDRDKYVKTSIYYYDGKCVCTPIIHKSTIPIYGGSMISDIIGSNELGFIHSEINGSSTTYLCDMSAVLAFDYVPDVWGHAISSGSNSDEFGVFYFNTESNADSYSGSKGLRIVYLP